MSSSTDAAYLELCQKFADRSRNSKLRVNLFDDEEEEEGIEFDEFQPNILHYSWITGGRKDSELMLATEEECLFVSNGKITKDKSEAFTCNVKKCGARVYLKQNGIAIKVADHTVTHGSMYDEYLKLQCRNYMREECAFAGASKSISDIFGEATAM